VRFIEDYLTEDLPIVIFLGLATVLGVVLILVADWTRRCLLAQLA